jgi:hypothetical protein
METLSAVGGLQAPMSSAAKRNHMTASRSSM